MQSQWALKSFDNSRERVYYSKDEILGLLRIRLQADFVGRTPEARLRKNGKILIADNKSRRNATRRVSARRVALAAQAKAVLEVNLSERHIRGGESTKQKYAAKKSHEP